MFVKGDFVNGIQGSMCDFVSNVLPNLVKFEKPIMHDYKVGSGMLETFKSCPSPEIAKVAFYGVEPNDGSRLAHVKLGHKRCQ